MPASRPTTSPRPSPGRPRPSRSTRSWPDAAAGPALREPARGDAPSAPSGPPIRVPIARGSTPTENPPSSDGQTRRPRAPLPPRPALGRPGRHRGHLAPAVRRRPGDDLPGRHGRARLADDVRHQHVRLQFLERPLGRLRRAHAPAARVGGGLGCVALAVWFTGRRRAAGLAAGAGRGAAGAALAAAWIGATGVDPFLAAIVVLGVVGSALASWYAAVERKALPALGWLALTAVIVQGALGGYRVRLNSTDLAAVHGCTGQAFFALMVSPLRRHRPAAGRAAAGIATAGRRSAGWSAGRGPAGLRPDRRRGAAAAPEPRPGDPCRVCCGRPAGGRRAGGRRPGREAAVAGAGALGAGGGWSWWRSRSALGRGVVVGPPARSTASPGRSTAARPWSGRPTRPTGPCCWRRRSSSPCGPAGTSARPAIGDRPAVDPTIRRTRPGGRRPDEHGRPRSHRRRRPPAEPRARRGRPAEADGGTAAPGPLATTSP